MHTRHLTEYDIRKYEDDIAQCYIDNLQIMDNQCAVDFTNRDEMYDYLFSLLECPESAVKGIFDDEEQYLFGLIIYDGIRLTDNGNAAQLHLATSKDLWGKDFHFVYEDELKDTMFDTLYCMIPAYCRPVVSLVKKLGFKKTGYIPKALPYISLKGEEKMYDELIYSWLKEKE